MDEKTNPSGGQLVLAGDPQQLGPVLRSPLAIEHGLGEWGEGWECCRQLGAERLARSHGVSLGAGTSLLERLMLHNPLYKKSSKGYNPQFVTKLLWNYRWGQGSTGMGTGRDGAALLSAAWCRSCACTPAPAPCSRVVPQLVLEMGTHLLSWVPSAPALDVVLPLPGPTRPSSGSPTSSSTTAS